MLAHAGEFRVAKMAQVLEVSRSGYYDWKQRKKSARREEDEEIAEAIRFIHEKSHGIYGGRKITQELNRRRSNPVNHKRVERLKQERGIHSKVAKKYNATTDSRHEQLVSENLLRRDFRADHPRQKMVSDVTFVWTKEGWLYVAGVMDLCGQKIVGLAMGEKNDTTLVLEALRDAREHSRNLRGCIIHSDRGSNYCSNAYQNKLQYYGAISSMSRTGDCWDNAPMESFWGKMKTEWMSGRYCTTRAEAKSKIAAYVYSFYNSQRLHESNGYLTPEEYYQTRKGLPSQPAL
jgi:putative transposase